MFDAAIDRIWGPWCDAVDPDGDPTCWRKVGGSQPGGICDDCWDLLSTKGHLAQRTELAGEPDAPEWVLERLADDPHELVRATVAERDDLPALARAVLVRRDEAGRVLRKLAKRSDLAPDEQRELLYSTDVAALRMLAGNPATTSEHKMMLAQHPDDGVRTAATGNNLGATQ